MEIIQLFSRKNNGYNQEDKNKRCVAVYDRRELQKVVKELELFDYDWELFKSLTIWKFYKFFEIHF